MVEFFYGADLFYSDDYFSEARNLVEIDSYRRLNGFLGISDPGKSWQVTLTGTNITNRKDNVSGIFAQNFTNIRTPLPPVGVHADLQGQLLIRRQLPEGLTAP